jgi:hypothetical protein
MFVLKAKHQSLLDCPPRLSYQCRRCQLHSPFPQGILALPLSIMSAPNVEKEPGPQGEKEPGPITEQSTASSDEPGKKEKPSHDEEKPSRESPAAASM